MLDLMALQRIYSFLTYPRRGVINAEEVSGTEIARSDNKLTKLLESIFDGAKNECNVPIIFVAENDKQDNGFRSILLSLLKRATFDRAKQIAQLLQAATPGTAGMALMFVCIGSDGPNRKRIVISRFPADEGVMAELGGESLTVPIRAIVGIRCGEAVLFVYF